MNTQLQKAFSAVSELSDDTQDAIAAELLTEVSHLKTSNLTPEQRAIVEERMAKPFDFADPAEVAALLDTTQKNYGD